ncbi:MAG: SPOR domain-containing protein [Chitinophagales bacterium]|nr:SPOR domain-containing protein [Chitinophagales bacterium]
MIRFITLLIFSVSYSLISAQSEDSTANVLKSSIIDHSGVQPYITAHPMLDKKKPFFQGYRIQIFSRNSKEEANKVKSEFYSKFPAMRCYLTYQQPYYKLRVGDYEDQESAKPDAKKLARTYPSSFLVPDEVRRTGDKDTDKDKK